MDYRATASTDSPTRSAAPAEIAWEHVRHEETAAFAAAADAALTGQLAVCAGSCGPGQPAPDQRAVRRAAQSGSGVGDRRAHPAAPKSAREYFQETHPQELFRECSVYCELGQHARDGAAHPRDGDAAAVEENGVAVVVIPGEVFLRGLRPVSGRSGRYYRPVRCMRPDDESLRQAADILNAADGVTILGGPACAGAHDELIQLAGTLQRADRACAARQGDIEYDNPYDVGMTGLLGFASGYKAIKEADVLLMLGTDFPYGSSIPTTPQSFRSTSAAATSAGARPIDLGLVGTVKDTLQRVATAVAPRSRPRATLTARSTHYRKTRKSLDALAVNDRDRTPIRPGIRCGAG